MPSPTFEHPSIAILAPDTLLSVTIERRGDGQDEVHIHPAGQGVWIARMAGEMGARPVLCTLLGGESGATLGALLGTLPGEQRIATTRGASGCYVTDRRKGARHLIASALRPAPERHELDDLVDITCAAAVSSRLLVVANPFPVEGLPLEVYDSIVGNARAAGIPILVDLSSPRLERVLPHRPDLVKLNDWELAEYVCGPLDGDRLLEAALRLQHAGARAVVVTRGEKPVVVVPPAGEPFEVVPPRFDIGFREGCGDTMMGAIAAAWAVGAELADAVVVGTAAGAANYLRHGLGTGRSEVVRELAGHVAVRPLLRTAA